MEVAKEGKKDVGTLRVGSGVQANPDTVSRVYCVRVENSTGHPVSDRLWQTEVESARDMDSREKGYSQEARCKRARCKQFVQQK